MQLLNLFSRKKKISNQRNTRNLRRVLSMMMAFCVLSATVLNVHTIGVMAAENWVTLQGFESMTADSEVPNTAVTGNYFVFSINTDTTYVNSGNQSLLCDYQTGSYPVVQLKGNAGDFVGDGLRFFARTINETGAEVNLSTKEVSLIFSDNTTLSIQKYLNIKGWYTITYSKVSGLTADMLPKIVGVKLSTNHGASDATKRKLYLDDLQVNNPTPAISDAVVNELNGDTASVAWKVSIPGCTEAEVGARIQTSLYYDTKAITQQDIDNGTVSKYTDLGAAASSAVVSTTLSGLPSGTCYFALKTTDTVSGKTVYANMQLSTVYKTILGFEGITSVTSDMVTCGSNKLSLNNNSAYVKSGTQSLRVEQTSSSNSDLNLMGAPGDFIGDGLRVYLWVENIEDSTKSKFSSTKVHLILDDNSVIVLEASYSNVGCNAWYTVDYAKKGITAEQQAKIKGLRFGLNQWNQNLKDKQSIYVDDLQVINPAPKLENVSAQIVDGITQLNWNVVSNGGPLTAINTRVFYSNSVITNDNLSKFLAGDANTGISEYTGLSEAEKTAASVNHSLSNITMETRYFALLVNANEKDLYAYLSSTFEEISNAGTHNLGIKVKNTNAYPIAFKLLNEGTVTVSIATASANDATVANSVIWTRTFERSGDIGCLLQPNTVEVEGILGDNLYLIVECADETSLTISDMVIGNAPTFSAVPGDVNGDNEFSVSDLVRIKKMSAEVADKTWLGDINEDGYIAEADDIVELRKDLLK